MKPESLSTVPVRLTVTFKFVVAFILLRHIFHEAHEFAHMSTARLFGSGWGFRDFNNVQPFPAGASPGLLAEISTGIAGPMFNFLFCWIGVFMIRSAKELKQVAAGIVLIFACLPFARIFTVLVRGGDEYGIARLFFDNPHLAQGITLAAVTAVLAYPVYLAFKKLPQQHRVRTWLAFLLLPMFFEGAVVLGLLNRVLASGFLAEKSYFGAPFFVLVVLLGCVVLFLLLSKHITGFLSPTVAPHQQKVETTTVHLPVSELPA